jgi:tetratricopeptide (TPR) repeat protein
MDPDSGTGQAGASDRRPPRADVSSSRGVQVGDHNVQHNVFVEQRAVAAPVALAQLPPLAVAFTGREAELAQVARLLAPPAGGGAVVVSAVAGLAGVGKTALTVHAAHAAREAGWFDGGVLFIDLHGYDEHPVHPGRALDALLRALGIPSEHVPNDTEQRAALYRSALDQIPCPVLVIADNASAEAQVRPLLPGPGPHRVIVTSRHTLAGLGARLLDVTVLDQAAAVRLLDAVLRTARPEDERIAGDQAAAARLAVLCDGLPLALQITAALLAADPILSTGELAEMMADEVRRLEALRYDDGGGGDAPSVAAAFELSYRQLDQDAARLFRLLSVVPGPDVSTRAATELAAWPTDRARAVIGRLVRAHLIESGGVQGRWQMHDLLRAYARHVPDASAGEREQALGRMLAWYLQCSKAASEYLRAPAGPAVSVEFADRDDALAWLDAERPGLIAAVTEAAAVGRHQEAMRLPLYLGNYLAWRRRFDDWLTVLAVSRDTARQLNDKDNEAAALGNIGYALEMVRRFEEAIIAHQGAMAIYRETGDRHAEGMVLSNLSTTLQMVRRFGEAISACQEAAAIFRETGDRHGEGMALTGLGNALTQVRRFEEAVSAQRDAAARLRETGDRRGEGMALNNLGIALREVRRFEEAVSAGQGAVAAYRETGDRHGEGMALIGLGLALAEVQRFEEAVSAYQAAVAIYREADDRHGEGMALNNLGIALLTLRRFDEAIAACQEAGATFRETGDRHAEGMALTSLGNALPQVRRFEEAVSAYQAAVAIFRETGDRHGEGQSLNNLALVHEVLKQYGRAAAYWRDAAASMRDVGEYEKAAHMEQLAANTETAD